MLNPKIFNEAQKILPFKPHIDCFAARINNQLSEYFSRRPDTEAKFGMLPGVLQKIPVEQEQALIEPFWPPQPWLSQILNLVAQEPLIYKPTATNLILPQDSKAKHPLSEKLSLMVAVLSRKNIGN